MTRPTAGRGPFAEKHHRHDHGDRGGDRDDREDEVGRTHRQRLEEDELAARAGEPDQQAVDGGRARSHFWPRRMKAAGMSIVRAQML